MRTHGRNERGRAESLWTNGRIGGQWVCVGAAGGILWFVCILMDPGPLNITLIQLDYSINKNNMRRYNTGNFIRTLVYLAV